MFSNHRGCLLFLALSLVLTAAARDQPRNAYDVSYLSCWQGRDNTDFTSRQERTAVLASRIGAKAFGAVVASAAGTGSCQNTTTLFASDGKTAPSNVYQVTPEGTQDGNGIRLVAWSPSGRKLLTEITSWAYGSDAGLGKLFIVYDVVTMHASELPVNPMVAKALGDKCDFDVSAARWISDSEVLLRARRHPYEPDGDPNCGVSTHLFRLDTNTLQLRPYRVAR